MKHTRTEVTDCIKVKNRIECVKCGYPYSESMYSDNIGNIKITCNSSQEEVNQYIRSINS